MLVKMRLRLSYIIIALLFCMPNIVRAQNASAADALFQAGDYTAASSAYSNLLRKSPDNQLFLYRYARCFQELGQVDSAIVYFEKAGDKYLLRHYHLASLYKQTYRFEQAAALFAKYLESCADDSVKREEVMQSIAYCKKGARYIKRVEDIEYVDSVTVPVDRLPELYRLSDESGKILLAEDGMPCYVTQKGDHRICTKQVDDRLQLLSCHRIMQTDECDTLPVAVNSSQNQSYPFMLTDGVTLYFASDKTDGLGGYDIYVTRYNHSTEEWYEPENIGFPFNSAANDYLYAEDEQAGIGYFATDRCSAEGYVTVYRFLLNDEKRVVTDSVRARQAAQLSGLRFREANSAEQKQQETASQRRGSATTSKIVISDSVVYYSLSQFRSSRARQCYIEVMALDSAIAEGRETLERTRLQYQKDPSNPQLQSLILTNERTLQNMLAQRDRLLMQVRKEEQQSLEDG